MELLPMESAELPEIDVEEASGVLELPITGWVVHPRTDSIRFVGFINRGSIHDPRREATIILHMPMSGFFRSLARTVDVWRRLSAAIH